ncbi:hypothetical protein ABWJ92_28550 [Streptomyces sp. NPDC000609]|uniref:hypothetical protein n=1 Tax=Streptomyces sp. NPDC000609 TaxID=3160957 RepID=UPI003396E0BA
MTRIRELYYYDYLNDFGLSGFGRTVCSRATLRTDAQVVLALAGAEAADLERLAAVDPGYTPCPSPGRADLAEAVLRELREATRSAVEEVRDVAGVLEEVVTTVDPDLGFRLLLDILLVYGVPVGDERCARHQALAEQFGYGADHLDDHLSRWRDGVSTSAQQ